MFIFSRLFIFLGAQEGFAVLLAPKETNQRKVPAAPCSVKGCALAISVVAEQGKAGFLGFIGSVLFAALQIKIHLIK
jgi:hypothetical protein